MSQYGTTAFAVVGYAACSSMMLIVNKLAVHLLPAPSFVLLAQVTCSWVAVKVCGLLGFIDVDELEWPKAKGFFLVSVAFLACIFANIKILQYCNVETFIVFRASTPMVIGVADWFFLGRELPNLRSTGAMMCLVVGACLYVYFDASFVVQGYIWVGIWYVIFSFDQVRPTASCRAARSHITSAPRATGRAYCLVPPIARGTTRPPSPVRLDRTDSRALSRASVPVRQLYIKHAVDNVQVRSNWGRVFYTNLWASVLLLGMTAYLEPHVLLKMRWGWAIDRSRTLPSLLRVPLERRTAPRRSTCVVSPTIRSGSPPLALPPPAA
jgi:hypothetical protein